MTQEKRLEESLEEPLEEELEADETIEEALEQEALAPTPHPNPVIRFLLAAKQFAVDFYEANFKSSPEESETETKKGSKINSSPRALREDFERRSKRSVGHITGNSVSSTRGNPTRQKKVKITAKTYKPELDRF